MDWLNNYQLKLAANWIGIGEVIAYPTEAVWGLGCDPYNPYGVEKLLKLKSRPVEKGLILIAGHIDQFRPLLQGLSNKQIETLNNSWPAPLTWLVPASDKVPDWIKGQYRSVALRVTQHPVAAALCNLYGGPIVSTSANPANRREARSALAVHRYFGRKIAAVSPGKVGAQQKPTEIRDLITGRVLR